MKKNSFELYYLDSHFNNGRKVYSEEINYIKIVGKGSLAKVYKISLKNNPNKFYAMKVISKE